MTSKSNVNESIFDRLQRERKMTEALRKGQHVPYLSGEPTTILALAEHFDLCHWTVYSVARRLGLNLPYGWKR